MTFLDAEGLLRIKCPTDYAMNVVSPRALILQVSSLLPLQAVSGRIYDHFGECIVKIDEPMKSISLRSCGYQTIIPWYLPIGTFLCVGGFITIYRRCHGCVQNVCRTIRRIHTVPS